MKVTQRYEIEEMLSQDAYGVAFRARDREEKRDVVLRRFFPNGRDGGGLKPEEQPPFLEAVGKLKELKLKELRKTFDGGCDPVDGIPFLVTDWVGGDTLGSFTQGKSLEAASVKDIVEVALKASQEISRVLGHEMLWVGCSEDSLIIPESGRGITFWVEPLASLNFRGLQPLAELAERLMGWKGKPAKHDSDGDGLAGWIRQIRANPKAWSLAQALEALHKPVSAATPPAAAVAQPQRSSSSSAKPVKPASVTQPATATKPAAATAAATKSATATKSAATKQAKGGATRKGAAPAKRPQKSFNWPLAVVVILLLLGGGGFAAWKTGKLDGLLTKFQSPKTPPPPTREEMIEQLRAKTMAAPAKGAAADSSAKAEAAPKPAEPPKPAK
ncbi:hypothetical protein [Luteolibacter soli]|uniref:Protein kinase domain-containing protein n=1 Tax=Luteolibacter soli TaxID=3135280 RepID=A0ABU9AUK3_9BACT